MTELELRELVVSTMRGWIGLNENDGSHKQIIDLYNTLNPLPRGYRVKYTDAWCAATVSAAAIKAGVTEIIPPECSCGEMIKLFKAHRLSKWQEDESITPQPGDVCFYDWDDSGAGDNLGAPEHAGTVTAAGGGKITVTEGNKSNAVGDRVLAVNGRYIRGFGLPNYAALASKAAPNPAGATLANLAADIAPASPDYWRDVLNGTRSASPANVRALMDKYHAALVAAKARK
jgi:hypothetical protein